MAVDKNKQIARREMDLFNARDLDGYKDLFAPDYVDRTPRAGLTPDREGTLQAMIGYLEAFPDMQATVDEQIAEGDLVVTRGTMRGTHSGALEGIPATGKTVSVTGVEIFRIRDGKIVEGWHWEDEAGLLRQLGVGEGMRE
ncbi:MAG TPA: ester cyclase [bacterium]|jgi:steroid delta-isomerase-like uncharacterized protein|nr:ester cyclase [bacterium]